MKSKFNTLFEQICLQTKNKKHIIKEDIYWSDEQIENMFKEQMIEACDIQQILFISQQQKQQYIDNAWENYGDDIIAYIEGDPTAEQELDQMVRNAIMANSESIFDKSFDNGIRESKKIKHKKRLLKESTFTGSNPDQIDEHISKFNKIRDEILIFELDKLFDKYTRGFVDRYGRGDFIDIIDKLMAQKKEDELYEFVDKCCYLILNFHKEQDRDKIAYIQALKDKLDAWRDQCVFIPMNDASKKAQQELFERPFARFKK